MAKACSKPMLSLCSAFAVFAVLAPAHGYADAGPGGPFFGLSGQWSGTGTVTMADGSIYRLRCKSANAVTANGRVIEQNLRCSSGKLRLDITSNVVSVGGLLSGSWAEATHRVRGTVSGLASRSGIFANVAGTGFAASMNVRTKGGKQSITMESFTLRPQRGTDDASVSVALQR
jgi:hypothetical protein